MILTTAIILKVENLFNYHMGSMSYYIFPLVINSLEGRHTQMDANTYTAKPILLNQASAVLEPMCALFIYVVEELLAVCYVRTCLQFDS